MQPYPQPPAPPTTPQNSWWLIYGASFGLGLVLITFSLTVAEKGIAYLFYFLLYIFNLLYLSTCLVAGILTAKKTRRAGSATLASLPIGLLFIISRLLFSRLFFARFSVGLAFAQIGAVSIIVFLPALLGIFLGFLGGLIGRSTETIRKTIGFFYAIGIILVITSAVVLLLYSDFTAIVDIALLIVAWLCELVAWILTLVQFARVQSWGAFVLTFFFSGIMVLIYLITGVQPSQPTPYAVLLAGAHVPATPVYPLMPPQPPQPDAVSILQQRFARGEIDGETYKRMFAMLTNPPTNPPRQ